MSRGERFVVDPSLFTLPYDHELCRALVRRGEAVRLIGRPLRPLESTVTAPDYRFDPLFYGASDRGGGGSGPRRWRKAAAHLAGLARLRRLVRWNRPAVVHVQWLPMPLADRLAFASMARTSRLVLTAHDAAAGGGRGFGRLQTVGWSSAVRCFSDVVVHGDEGADALRRCGVPEGRIHVIGHPPLPLAGEVGPARRRSDDGFVLVLFGEIKPYKGVDTAIEALSRLPDGLGGAVRLIVAGRPRMDLGPLRRLAARLGVADRVEWIDRYLPVDELPEVLARADAYVLPYRSADASGVLAQLLGLGRPIIASRVGSLASVVGDGGCGVLVEPDDPGDLAAAVARLVRDPELAAALGGAAERAVRALPTWDDMARRLATLDDGGGGV